LFGHWWFEGITWIKDVIKKLRQYTAVQMQTASEYLESQPPTKAIELPESSWGAGGHYQVWYNDGTEWMWPIIHNCEKTMQEVEDKYRDRGGIYDRALKQALRELLLLQSSDWPFLITTGQAWQYAKDRFNGHVDRFHAIVDMLNTGNFDEAKLSKIEDIDNCFPNVDHGWFSAHAEREAQPVP
jgi:1,4-alpha-glucan branching enzyme